MSSYDEAPTKEGGSDDAQSLSARRARLRGSLAKAMPDPYANTGSAITPATGAPGAAGAPGGAGEEQGHSDEAPVASMKTKEITIVPVKELKNEAAPDNGSPSQNEPQAVARAQAAAAAAKLTGEHSPPQPVLNQGAPAGSPTANPFAYTYGLDPTQAAPPPMPANMGAGQAIDLLSNIDQSMSVCAMNLATLQKCASEQTEALAQLAETMRTQTFSELGLNLNSLMESLSAALEPMKAVGELVPAIDQLVSHLQDKEVASHVIKLTPEQLVMNLADQLSSGQIDPWTFKCAYMAVYPDDHPADLLHRLVDLLGTQRLSGDLFRAAYDAVQAAEEPPPPVHKRIAPPSNTDPSGQPVQVVQDEALLAELESLRAAQQELQRREEQREEELSNLLTSKESEMNARWEEFGQRHEQLTNTLRSREERLQERENELAKQAEELKAKDSENQVLKAQMEELREQTQEMVKELQKQLNETRQQQEEMKTSAPKPTPGFFDVASGQEAQTNLFDNAPARPLFQQQMQQPNKTQADSGPREPVPSGQASIGITPAGQPGAPIPAAPQMPIPPGPQSSALPSNQAIPSSQSGPISAQPIPRPPAAPNTYAQGSSGSYGTGVRAQVFEVIVRQALAGAPWREICAGPMQVNNISPDEVEAEVKRRQALLKK
jgi:hypothetical protein